MSQTIPSRSLDQQIRLRFFRLFACCTFAIAVTVAIFEVIAGTAHISLALAASTIIPVIIGGADRQNRYFELTVHCFLLSWSASCTYLIWVSGGIAGSTSYTYIPVPLVALVFLPIARAGLWAAIVLIATSAFYVLEADGIHSSVVLSPTLFANVNLITLVGSTGLVFIAGLVFRGISRNMLERLAHYGSEASATTAQALAVLQKFSVFDFSMPAKTDSVTPEFVNLVEGINSIGGKLQSSVDSLKHSENALKAINERLEFLLATLPVVPYTRQSASPFQYTYLGDVHKKLLNEDAPKSAEPLSSLRAAVEPDSLAKFDRFPLRVRSEQSSIDEYRLQKQNGETIWVADHATFVPESEHREAHITGVLENITSRKQEEARIAKMQAQLIGHEKLSALGQMSAGIAHEIKNPLAIISLRSQRLSKMLAKEPLDVAKASEFVGDILQTILHIDDVVNGLSAISRQGEKDPYTEESLRRIFKSTINLARETCDRFQIALSIDWPDEDLCIECRPGQIIQVLVNLVLNSCDAVKGGSVKKVHLGCDLAQDKVRVYVADSGPGVPEALRQQIMEPFFTTKPNGEGTGLGLSISQGIVRDHGGALQLESATKETTFSFTLPARRRLRAAA